MYGTAALAGGAPANVAACASLLRCKSAFLGGISKDAYGELIFRELDKRGVDLRFAKRTDRPTAIARVSVSSDGNRSFAFERENTADLCFCEEDVADIPFKSGDILHFCSNCLMDEGMRAAHIAAVTRARSAGAAISYDPNLRPALWTSEEEMLTLSSRMLAEANIVKLSEEEARLFCPNAGSSDEEIFKALFALSTRAELVVITMGEKGGMYALLPTGVLFCGQNSMHIERFAAPNKAPKDTDGAGDCFVGALLASLATRKTPYSPVDVKDAIRAAVAASAISVGRAGAIPSYPSFEELIRSPYFKGNEKG